MPLRKWGANHIQLEQLLLHLIIAPALLQDSTL